MSYIGWVKPSDCISFSAWIYWDVYTINYSYIRIFGFEFNNL